VRTLGAALVVPQLSAVAAIAAPIAQAVASIIGTADQELKLGLHQLYRYQSQEELAQGYYLAAAVDRQLDLSD
jgi:hypothetical protein